MIGVLYDLRNPKQNKKNKFEFSKHATDQSVLRNIGVDEIHQAILNGERSEWTVDKIQKIILGHHLKPLKTINTPVFEFS